MCNDSRGINKEGHLTFGGADTVSLAETYATPLYVMDGDLIEKNCRMYMGSIDKYYGGQGLCCYASKAFSCKEIYRMMKKLGMGIDVVSMGELYTALSVGFPPDKICYHGNNKPRGELFYAIQNGVTRIVADSFAELDAIDEIALSLGKKVSVLLRLCPGVDAHTHDFIRTGSIDSKFGFAIELGTAMEAVKYTLSKKSVGLKGFHCHIGSQIFDIEPFCHTAEVMIDFIGAVKKETGCEIDELNLGGGFGIRYVESDDPIEYDKYMEKVSVAVKNACQKNSVKLPFIIIEPGRSIVGNAGITLYEVGNVRQIPSVRTYVAVDGGMTDNIRYALYGSEYEFTIANKAAEEKTETVTIAGRCCESGDLVGKDVALQKAEKGDIVAAFSTGAYNYSMSSNYNRVLKPAVVMLNGGKPKVIVKRETPEDVVRNDI